MKHFALNVQWVITLERIIFVTLIVLFDIFQTPLLDFVNCVLMIAILVTVTKAALLAMSLLTSDNLTKVLQDAFLCKDTSTK